MPAATTAESGADGTALGGPRPRRALISLCITVTTSYGVLYYAFPVLSVSISAETGWSLPALMAAFSAGQVASALCGILVGRWVDRSGPRAVMTTGSLLAAPAVAGLAAAPSLPWFFLAWLLAGTAMAMLFYPPAFAALTRWYGPGRVRALTVLTLVAGLASTIFAPLTAALEAWLGWRASYLVLAALLAAVTLPAHYFLLRLPWPRVPGTTENGSLPWEQVRATVTGRAFLALVGALSLGAFVVYAVVVNLVPLFEERGWGPEAAAAALAVGGIGQVLGRFCYAPLARRTGPVVRTVAVLATCALSTALIGLVPGPLSLLLAVSLLVGASRGIFTLIEATAVSDRWGAAGYGTLNGILHVPLVMLLALGPWAGSMLAVALGGFVPTFALLAGIGVLAAALAAATRVAGPPQRSETG